MFKQGLKRTLGPSVDSSMFLVPAEVDATDSVRCYPRTTRGREPAVGRTALTLSPIRPRCPGHPPPRGPSSVPPVCRRGPPSAGWTLARLAWRQSDGRRPPRSCEREGQETIPISPLELQVADTLPLGAQTDIEGAVHLPLLFEESLSQPHLEEWVTRLDVQAEYERLTRV